MSLKIKTLLIIGSILLCLVITFLVIVRLFQRNVTAEQEKAVMQRELELVLHALEREIDHLDLRAIDWAYWDDTYAFVWDENDAYRQSNLVDSTFQRLRLNYLILLNTDGKVIYGRGFDLETEAELPLPADLIAKIFPDGPFLPHADAASGRRGLLNTLGGPLLFAARPILNSEDEGPARGSLVMARWFDNSLAEELSIITQLDLSFQTLDKAGIFESAAPDGLLFTGEPYYYQELSATGNVGFTLLKDINEEPVLLLEVFTEREVYGLVQSKLRIFNFLLLLAGVVFGVSMLRFLDRSVIAKLAQLSNDITLISRSGDFSKRVKVFHGRDEISVLAVETNSMLNTLEISQQKIFENEIKFKAAFESSHDAITLYSFSRRKFIGCNKRALELFGLADKDAFLKSKSSIFSPARQQDGSRSRLAARKKITENQRQGGFSRFEWLHKRKDGSTFPAEVILTSYKLGEEYILQANIRDISEQKEAEQALQDELEKASQLHKCAIPKTFPEASHLSLAAHYHPARKLGGDFYDVIKKEDKLIFYLSDVTGHGLDGALLSVFVKSTISNYLNLSAGELITPKLIAAYLADQFFREDYPQDYFICIFLAVLDLTTNELSYIGSGFQTAPLVVCATGEMAELTSRGLPISLTIGRELLDFQEEKIKIMPGSTMLFHTDGLTEQRVGNVSYGERLKEVFFTNSYLPPTEIVQVIKEDFRQFNQGSLQGDDDITFLIVQLKPEGQEEIFMELDCSFAEIEKVRQAVARVTADWPEKEIFFLGLNEVISNAIEHGNGFAPGSKVRVSITAGKKYIHATVEDEGEGFCWRNKIDLPMRLEGDTERGRGIALTKMCCDRLLYNDKGNRVFLFKTL
ncbi:MAG: CHASE4 domain-containing protein [Bacillota bacterium]